MSIHGVLGETTSYPKIMMPVYYLPFLVVWVVMKF